VTTARERGADDDRDRQVDDVAAEQEVLEALDMAASTTAPSGGSGTARASRRRQAHGQGRGGRGRGEPGRRASSTAISSSPAADRSGRGRRPGRGQHQAAARPRLRRSRDPAASPGRRPGRRCARARPPRGRRGRTGAATCPAGSSAVRPGPTSRASVSGSRRRTAPGQDPAQQRPGAVPRRPGRTRAAAGRPRDGPRPSTVPAGRSAAATVTATAAGAARLPDGSRPGREHERGDGEQHAPRAGRRGGGTGTAQSRHPRSVTACRRRRRGSAEVVDRRVSCGRRRRGDQLAALARCCRGRRGGGRGRRSGGASFDDDDEDEPWTRPRGELSDAVADLRLSVR
jgi:hypothetical protein